MGSRRTGISHCRQYILFSSSSLSGQPLQTFQLGFGRMVQTFLNISLGDIFLSNLSHVYFHFLLLTRIQTVLNHISLLNALITLTHSMPIYTISNMVYIDEIQKLEVGGPMLLVYLKKQLSWSVLLMLIRKEVWYAYRKYEFYDDDYRSWETRLAEVQDSQLAPRQTHSEKDDLLKQASRLRFFENVSIVFTKNT